jgi:hypothetical protein
MKISQVHTLPKGRRRSRPSPTAHSDRSRLPLASRRSGRWHRRRRVDRAAPPPSAPRGSPPSRLTNTTSRSSFREAILGSGLAAALALTTLLADDGLPARWLMPVAVALVLAASLRRTHTRSVTESALTSAWLAPGLQVVATALRSPAQRPDSSVLGHGDAQWLGGTDRWPGAPSSGLESGTASLAGDSFCLTKSPSTARFTWVRIGSPSASAAATTRRLPPRRGAAQRSRDTRSRGRRAPLSASRKPR